MRKKEENRQPFFSRSMQGIISNTTNGEFRRKLQ